MKVKFSDIDVGQKFTHLSTGYTKLQDECIDGTDVKDALNSIEDEELDQPDFNFDLKRMKEGINSEFIQLPDDLNGDENIRNWLLNKS